MQNFGCFPQPELFLLQLCLRKAMIVLWRTNVWKAHGNYEREKSEMFWLKESLFLERWWKLICVTHRTIPLYITMDQFQTAIVVRVQVFCSYCWYSRRAKVVNGELTKHQGVPNNNNGELQYLNECTVQTEEAKILLFFGITIMLFFSDTILSVFSNCFAKVIDIYTSICFCIVKWLLVWGYCGDATPPIIY